MTLSSSEAEWLVLLETVKKHVHSQITAKHENISQAPSYSKLTMWEHVDIKNKYANDYVEDRTVKTVFIQSAQNDSKILTNNLSGYLHESHSKRIMVGIMNDLLEF